MHKLHSNFGLSAVNLKYASTWDAYMLIAKISKNNRYGDLKLATCGIRMVLNYDGCKGKVRIFLLYCMYMVCPNQDLNQPFAVPKAVMLFTVIYFQ